MLYNLNLTADYCPDWGFWEAIREIIQNGDDQERNDPLNIFTINYDSKKELLTLSSKESILNRETILMGKTIKADDDNSTGQYGEGYKVALAVLTRLGKKVVIKNFKLNERWEAVLKKDKKYNNAEVVKINISKFRFTKTPDNNLSWEVHNVSKKDWLSIQDKYLNFNKNLDKFTDRENESVLFDKKYKGCVFVNGLFVEKSNENLAFGYSFTPKNIKLDRDRRAVEGFYLKYYASKILAQYGNESEINAKKLIRLISKEYADIEHLDSHTNLNNFIVDKVKDSFSKKHGKNAYPVSTQEEMELVSNRNSKIKAVITNNKENKLLKKTKEYQDLDSFCEDRNITKDTEDTPTDLLNSFLLKYNDDFGYHMKEDLLDLIKKSEKWENQKKDDIEEKEEAVNNKKEVFEEF
jgi:hypothetical protein